ncbi:MAG: glycosyltransferase, partial [Holosporaceae bacterium]|nr:glycosyltransferase [Holosporaceae bacterium]
MKENVALKTEIKVSIIVPIYNVEEFLEKCLDTIVNQTLREIEIICVNDGSLDGSSEILSRYVGKYPQIIVINQENLGPSMARNNGMAIARGEYIGFVDSDDWIELNYFEELFRAAQKYDADIACCNFFRVYPRRKARAVMKIIEREGVHKTTRDKFNVTDTPKSNYVFNKIYRRSMLEENKIQFKPGVYFEDIIFTPQVVFLAKKIAATPLTFYSYRVNENSIIRGKQNNKKRLDYIAARWNFIDFANKNH